MFPNNAHFYQNLKEVSKNQACSWNSLNCEERAKCGVIRCPVPGVLLKWLEKKLNCIKTAFAITLASMQVIDSSREGHIVIFAFFFFFFFFWPAACVFTHSELIKVPMKCKTSWAHMKGFSKRRRIVFSFFWYLLSFQRYSRFCTIQIR